MLKRIWRDNSEAFPFLIAWVDEVNTKRHQRNYARFKLESFLSGIFDPLTEFCKRVLKMILVLVDSLEKRSPCRWSVNGTWKENRTDDRWHAVSS